MKSAATSAIVMSAGDLVCQSIMNRARATAATSTTTNSYKEIDLKQTQRFALIGLTLHGPFFHAGFQALDRLFGPAPTLKTALTKTTAGQLTLFPVYVGAFFTYMGVLEGLSWRQCKEKLRSAAPATLLNGTVFWPIVNVFNFMYVPSSKRVLYVNACGLVWNAFLSWQNTIKGQVVGFDADVRERPRRHHHQQQHSVKKKNIL